MGLGYCLDCPLSLIARRLPPLEPFVVARTAHPHHLAELGDGMAVGQLLHYLVFFALKGMYSCFPSWPILTR